MRDLILECLYEGPHYFGSTVGAPDFGNSHMNRMPQSDKDSYPGLCITLRSAWF